MKLTTLIFAAYSASVAVLLPKHSEVEVGRTLRDVPMNSFTGSIKNSHPTVANRSSSTFGQAGAGLAVKKWHR